MSTVTAERYHDISCGHRVYGHESKCAHLHGHNYRVHFEIEGIKEATDSIGRVMDFSVIKSVLCEWLEKYWDHKFLVWERDPIGLQLKEIDKEGVVIVYFNPTAENMAQFLVENLGPTLLKPYGVKLVKVKIEETRKCSVNFYE